MLVGWVDGWRDGEMDRWEGREEGGWGLDAWGVC